MELQYKIEKESLFVPMPREVDHHVAKSISREIDFLIDSWHVRNVVFDFAETEFMDSSVIGVMIGRTKTMKLYRGEVYAIHMCDRAKRIFEKSGMERIIRTDFCEKEEAAEN